IGVYDTISTGQQINNKAAIYFDFNEPIITNNWQLTADNGGLNSFVHSLQEEQTETEISLHWSGTDQGAGIIYYDLLFRKNNSSWQYAKVHTTENSMLFPGETGAHY